MKIWKVLGLTAVAAASLYALTACATKPDPMDDKATASITSYNHTPDYIHQFYVNGTWGGNSFAYGGGGSFVCCLIYPKTWRPGLTAKVKWTTSSSDPNAEGDAAKEHWHEAIVPIEKYVEEADTLNVHFLPGGKIRLIISNKGPGQGSYPGPSYPVKPADFHFEPSRRAAQLKEERARAQAAGRARLEAEMRALKGGLPAAPTDSSPSTPGGDNLPPPPVLPKGEK
ncbi:MAG: DUF3304 domain-containing protein [Ralstonia sp.]|jgi:hypothetical protein|uniref:DUF3304 domain-containing protein n=1 Tax=Ralstonia wenshanensis TaxID=2842456 RepID=A0AAD2EUH3_9RALS|nr:DUF3304 domain-containing protein [Ralstonia wenshanensis]CAJ0703192.1 hypothetical protein LMG18091_03869 [Ralstonia wenshanensis]